MKKIYPQTLAVLLAVLSARASALESTHYVIDTVRSNVTLGPDQNFWYATFAGIVRLTPDGQSVTFPISGDPEFNAVAFGADGNIWTVSRYTNILYAITTAGAVAHMYPLSTDGYYAGMAEGSDGRIWIASNDTSLTAVDTAGTATIYPANGYIGDIVLGPDGNLWITADTQILRVAVSGSVTPFEMPDNGTTTGGVMVAGPDGKMWLSANNSGCPFSPCIQFGSALVSVSVDGATTIYRAPDGNISSSLSMAFGADGNPWLMEDRFNEAGQTFESVLLRMTSNGIFTAYRVDGFSGQMESDSDGNLWFGYGDQITKLIVPPDLVFFDGIDAL